MARFVRNQVLSTVSILWVMTNLACWLTLLVPVVIARAPWPADSRARKACDAAVAFIYRGAVRFDSFWMCRVIGVTITVRGEAPDNDRPVVIANHRTWLDVPVIQEVICRKAPIVSFLIKRELVWVPIVGWVAIALSFPRLYRGGGGERREADYRAIRDASVRFNGSPGALLIFPEGTRYTDAKRDAGGAPFRNALAPRRGGLSVLKDTLPPETPVIDVTVCYDDPTANFWQCLHGRVRHVLVDLDSTTLGEIDDPAAWLMTRWQRKDELLAAGTG